MNDLLDSQVDPRKLRCVAIARGIWPNLHELDILEVSRRLVAVDDVLEGRPTPTLSRVERERIKSAWVDEAPRP